MAMDGYWKHSTRIGEARIVLRSGRWRIEIGGEGLGAYDHPQKALDDLVHGHAFSHSLCADTSTLGLPDALADWVFVRAAASR